MRFVVGRNTCGYNWRLISNLADSEVSWTVSRVHFLPFLGALAALSNSVLRCALLSVDEDLWHSTHSAAVAKEGVASSCVKVWVLTKL
jgi:hypothetical protein